MVSLFETELPKNKSILFALTRIFGIGRTSSFLICKTLGFSSNLLVNNLSDDQILKIIKTIESLDLQLSSDLKKINVVNLKDLVNIKSYRGLRRIQGFPVRGQRTHTNAKTSKKQK